MYVGYTLPNVGVPLQLLGPDADGARFFQSAGKVTERSSCTAGGGLCSELQAGFAGGRH